MEYLVIALWLIFFLIFTFAMVTALLLTTVIHELVHVLAAKALGLEVVEISFQFLPKRFAFQLGGIDIVHTRKNGLATVTMHEGKWWQDLIISLSPPLVSLTLAILAALVLRQVISLDLSILALAVFTCSLEDFFSNLLPKEGTDGAMALAYLRLGLNRS